MTKDKASYGSLPPWMYLGIFAYMFLYLHTHVSTYIHVCIHKHVYIYIYKCVYMHMYIYMYFSIYHHIHIYVSMYTCTFIYFFSFIFILVYVYVTCTHQHIQYTYTYGSVYVCLYTHIHLYLHIYKNTYTSGFYKLEVEQPTFNLKVREFVNNNKIWHGISRNRDLKKPTWVVYELLRQVGRVCVCTYMCVRVFLITCVCVRPKQNLKSHPQISLVCSKLGSRLTFEKCPPVYVCVCACVCVWQIGVRPQKHCRGPKEHDPDPKDFMYATRYAFCKETLKKNRHRLQVSVCLGVYVLVYVCIYIHKYIYIYLCM